MKTAKEVSKSKCREWEKLRREQLNKSFITLSKLLPNYDSSLSLSKINILRKAAGYIEELQQKLKDVLTGEGVKLAEREEIKTLYERIKKLLLRNEQLSNLLRDARIRIPSEYGTVKDFKEPLQWSNKISAEQAKKIAEKEAQKENKKETEKQLKKPKTKKVLKKSGIASPHKGTSLKNGTKKVNSNKKASVINVQLSNIIPPRQNLTKPSLQPCFIIAGTNPVNGVTANCKRTNKSALTVATNSRSLSTPKMASIIAPPRSSLVPKINSSLGSLGPGTLILANGNIVPILPQPPPVLPTPTIIANPTPILLKPPINNTTLIVMPTKNSKKSTPTVTSNSQVKLPSSSNSTSASTPSTVSTNVPSIPTKTFAHIRPKIGVTRTTQVNKVPIPALSSRYSSLLTSTLKSSAPNASPEKQISASSEKKCEKKENKKRKLKKTEIDKMKDKRLKVDSSKEDPIVTTSKKEGTDEVNLSAVTEEVEESVKHSDNKSSDDNAIVSVPLEKSKTSEVNAETAVNDEQKDEISEEIKSENNPTISEVVAVSENKETGDELATTEDSKNEKSQVVTESSSTVNSTLVEAVTALATENLNSDVNNVEQVEVFENKKEVANSVTTDSNKLPTSAASDIKVTVADATEIQDKNLELGMNLTHSELSNDIFSSLQVPIGGQNPESTSPTAAFLLAFPLVSSLTGVKVTEVIEEENSDSRHGTPTLLQIGTMDTTKTTQSLHAESLTPNLLNLDNFSFFSGKDVCGNFYSSFDNSNNVYSGNVNPPALENTKNSSCGKQNNTDTKQVKTVKDVPLNVNNRTDQVENRNVTKSNSVTGHQNSFVQQDASVSFSKSTATAPPTSYAQETQMLHYNRQKIAATSSSINYSSRSSDLIQSSNQYSTATSNTVSAAQCNTYNPFSDFSKTSTMHSYSTFSKSYGDPLYTNSSNYNYPQNNGNNFEQSIYYPSKPAPSKTSHVATAYGANPNYSDQSYSMDCKNKRDSSVNQRHNNPVIYYPHSKNQAKEKFPTHASSTKVSKLNNQPKPPINWMTTPDFRQQSANADYLVPPPFAKEIDYNPNSFYSSNSFANTTHTSYFNATSTMYATPEFQNSISDNRKTFDSSLPIISSANAAQRNEFEENQFSWSPTKLPQFLETPHSFVSSTLPTLVGDLALGTTQTPFTEQKVDQGNARDHMMKSKENSRRSKMHHAVGYDNNQGNFLSVSQLVESKTDLGGTNRGTNRRSNSNRNVKSSNSHKNSKHSHSKTVETTKELSEGANQLDVVIDKKQNVSYNTMQNVNGNSNWMAECSNKPRHGHKNPQSSYSAEALIGHQDHSDNSVPKQRYRQQQNNYSSVNKAIPIPSFLSDNIVPYFPPVEIPQDNNFIQTNTNYQAGSLPHGFSASVQNNSYSSAPYISTATAAITSNYLPTSGLIPEFGTHDYGSVIPDNIPDKVGENKHCSRSEVSKQAANNTSNRVEDRLSLPQQVNVDCTANSNFTKKSKHKHPNENNLPGIVDFGFLSMPNTINSPILPDDFHAHSNFLPPPTPGQLYSCKNPLYSKQPTDLNSGSLLPLPPVAVSRSGPQHFENSAPAANVGSSLTSFNLSAIFPEINKGPVPLPGLYSESTRNKNYNFQRNYLGSSVQVSFNNKSTSSSSYVNSLATSFAPSN